MGKQRSRWIARLHFTITLVFVLLAGFAPITLRAAPASATYSVAPDSRGQPTIRVAGTGARVNLAQISNGPGVEPHLLVQPEPGVWQLNANLLLGRGVTLELSPAAGVRELRLRSQASAAPVSGYDYASFVYLRTDNGSITIDGVQIRSWNPTTGTVDNDPANGRAYILAKYDARMDIANAELSYLGSADGESYGVSWRDTNDPDTPTLLRRRVTGEVLNSRFHHNYYGVYTFQASKMLFRDNQFAHNLSYGFDPHDYSTGFLVEDNQAFGNGNHGFIISRGCTAFIFRRNSSFQNSNPDPTRLAHGFMLDAGSPNSDEPQAPSTDNLLEQNLAYDNEGYGLRILGSNNNIVRGNHFERNRQGVTVEQGSSGNRLEGNQIIDSRSHGIFVRGGAEQTSLLNNSVSGSGGHALYIKAGGGIISGNSLVQNQGSSITVLPETDEAQAARDLALPGEIPDEAGAGLMGSITAETVLAGTLIKDNLLRSSGRHGIELKGAGNSEVTNNLISNSTNHGIYLSEGASDNLLIANIISGSGGSGIRANGADTLRNSWSKNLLFANQAGPIIVTDGANGGVRAPLIELGNGQISGRATPGALVEIFSSDEHGRLAFEQQLHAGSDGSFGIAVPPQAHALLAVATDASGNSSPAELQQTRYFIYLPLVGA